MRKFLLPLLAIICWYTGYAQVSQKEKIKVFIDCYCPMDFIRTEINLVDFVLDNVAADVHVLITEQNNGGGGDQYQLIFYGQHTFKNQKDTLRFNTLATNTDFEERALLVKYLKMGLVSFIAKTDAVKDVSLVLKKQQDGDSGTPAAVTTDKWNYWVYRVGANGNLNGDKIYKSVRLSGHVSANRITDQVKLTFSLRGSKNKTRYTIEDPTGVDEPLIINNNNYDYRFSHQYVKSLNQHWSLGYNSGVYSSTFSNYQVQATFNPAIEYNIFPYSESNNKFLTFRYGVDVRYNNYFDTTIYAKKSETLTGHGLSVNLDVTQKWGSANAGVSYHNYFLNSWKYFNLSFSGSVDVRITGGLSFNTGVFAGLVRDQLSLSGKNASQDDILIRRRQLASSYNYYTWFGLNYRFGSKLNNFVNPRFENGNGGFFFSD